MYGSSTGFVCQGRSPYGSRVYDVFSGVVVRSDTDVDVEFQSVIRGYTAEVIKFVTS